MEILTWQTPLGPLWAPLMGGKPSALHWGAPPANAQTAAGHPLQTALQNYFNKQLQKFDINQFITQGTPFQKRVWQALAEIPHGQTVTYGYLAQKLNSSPRAVGGAVGANPLPIFIPCHRVMGANGKLTGFSAPGGIATKKWLLNHEGIPTHG